MDDWQSQAIDQHARLRAAGDERGALGCAAATLERLHRDLGAPPTVDNWAEAFDDDIVRANLPAGVVDRCAFRAALAVLGRRPTHPALPLWHARALAFLREPGADADDALRAAYFAFEYAVRGGNFPQAREIVRLARGHGADASAAMRRHWLTAEALEAWLASDHARARRAVALALAEGAGYAAWEQGASAAISEGDLAQADRCLDAMTKTLDPKRTQDVAHAHFLAAARERLAGDDAAASAALDACLEQDATNVPPFFTTLWQLGRAHLDVARGRHRQAGAALAIVLGRATSHYWSFLHFSALMSRTWLRIRQRRAHDAMVDLRSALALAAAGGYRNCDPWWDRQAIDEIARFASTLPRAAAALADFAARRPSP